MIESIHDLDSHSKDPASEPINSGFPMEIWKIMALCYGALLVIALVVFAQDEQTRYVVSVCLGLALMFFGIPWLLMKTEARSRHNRRRSFTDFLGKGLRTLTGPLEGREAMVQILLVPAVLASGMLAIGVVDVLERHSVFAFN